MIKHSITFLNYSTGLSLLFNDFILPFRLHKGDKITSYFLDEYLKEDKYLDAFDKKRLKDWIKIRKLDIRFEIVEIEIEFGVINIIVI